MVKVWLGLGLTLPTTSTLTINRNPHNSLRDNGGHVLESVMLATKYTLFTLSNLETKPRFLE